MREGHELVGYGMATGIWEALQTEATVRGAAPRAYRVVSRSRAHRGHAVRRRAGHIAPDLARHGHGLTFRHADAERYAVR